MYIVYILYIYIYYIYLYYIYMYLERAEKEGLLGMLSITVLH